MKPASHELSRKTLCWVGLAHVLVLLLLAFGGRWMLQQPREDFIPLIGLPDQTNPRDGTPGIEGSTPAGKPELPPGPAPNTTPHPVPQPRETAAPTPPQPVVEQKIPAPPVQPKEDFPSPDTHTAKPEKPEKIRPVEPPPVTANTAKPAEPKPKKSAVNVDLNHTVIRKPGPDKPVKNTSENNAEPHAAKGGGGGLNAGDVENKLAGAIGGRSGVVGGTGNSGTPGIAGGSAAGDAYKTLIKITLEKHWTAPLVDPQVSTVVRIRIDADASVHFLAVETPSGNTAFDESVVQAVQTTKRMPSPPPPSLGHPDYETTVRFRPKGDI